MGKNCGDDVNLVDKIGVIGDYAEGSLVWYL